MQFGGAQICFEHTSGQLAAQPVIVERRDGYRCLVLQDVPLFELPDVEADEVVVQRCAFDARGGMALSTVVDQVICTHQASNRSESSRIALTRLDLAWALAEGLRARGASARYSGTWRRLYPESESRSADFLLCPVDGHAKRLKVSAWISSVSAPLHSVPTTLGSTLVVRDVGGLEALRKVLTKTGAVELVAPKEITTEFQRSNITVSSTTQQESFNW